ncbi:MAG: NosD domain-containing protein [Candidatus Hodarchaeales archaeon]
MTHLAKRSFIWLLFALLLVITIAAYPEDIRENKSLVSEIKPISPSSTSLIDHDPVSITSDADFVSLGCSGDGSSENPYIIEDYRIETSEEKAISISSTSSYFVIRNCFLVANARGIDISDVADGTATVINNTCSDSVYGMYIWSTTDVAVSNNDLINNDYGLFIHSCPNSNVTSNNCFDNDRGILLRYSPSSNVINNTFTNDGGLDFDETSVNDYQSNTVDNNTVNGKEFGYLVEQANTTISDPKFGQLFLIGCSNVTVTNQQLINVSLGMRLRYGNGNIITNNSITSISMGIRLDWETDTKICNNTIKGGYTPIYNRVSSWTVISNNTCYGGSNGVIVTSSDYPFIFNNTCMENNHGINLLYVNHGVIVNNTLSKNTGYGVYIDSSSNDNNTICSNIFNQNNPGGCQAFDQGSNNHWYNSSTNTGNYWSNYVGTGSYSMDGAANSYDPFPMGIYEPGTVVLMDIPGGTKPGEYNLSWSASNDTNGYIDHYVVETANDNALWKDASFYQQWTTTNTTQEVVLYDYLEVGTQYFRVKAVDNEGMSSDWSNIISYSYIYNIPEFFSGEGNYTTSSVYFSWSWAMDCSDFQLQVTDTLDTWNDSASFFYNITLSSQSVTVEIGFDKHYYSRVRGIYYYGGFTSWSGVIEGNTLLVDTLPPNITLISPVNDTYPTNDIWLNFTISENVSWIGYSLDGALNVTITGNISLGSLSGGSHHIIIYATDTSDNTGVSARKWFTIELPDGEAPLLEVSGLVNGTVYSGNIIVSAIIADESELASVTMWITNGEEIILFILDYNLTLINVTSNDWTFTVVLDTTLLSNGDYEVFIQVVDTLGNVVGNYENLG